MDTFPRHSRTNRHIILIVFAIIGQVLALNTYADDEIKAITLLYTGDINGYFSHLCCDEMVHGANSIITTDVRLARIAGLIEHIRHEERIAGNAEPVLIDYGDIFSPFVLTRHLAGQERGPELLADVFQSLGHDVICFGNREFDLPISVLQRIMTKLYAKGVTIIASNIDVDERVTTSFSYLNKDPRSNKVRQYAIIERDALRIGIISLLPENIKTTVAADRTAGLSIQPPQKRLIELVQALRTEENVDIVVLSAHIEDSSSSPSMVIDLIKNIEGIDIVICNAFDKTGDAASTIESIQFAGGGTRVVGLPKEAIALGKVSLQLRERAGGWQVVSASSETLIVGPDGPIDGTLKTTLEQIGRDYCQNWNTPLGAGILDRPMSHSDYLDYLLEIIRNVSGAELALMNQKGIYKSTDFPLDRFITRDVVYQTMPYDNHLYTIRMTGADLKALADKHQDIRFPGRSDVVRILGLSSDYRVNGRPLDAAEIYTIVTTEFIVNGGDSVMSAQQSSMKPVFWPGTKENLTLRELVLRFFEENRFKRASDNHTSIDLHRNFPDLSRKILWKMDVRFNTDYLSRMKNSAASEYSDSGQPPLTADEMQMRTLSLNYSLTADTIDFQWLNLLAMVYARTRIADDIESESADKIFFESTLKSRYLKNRFASETKTQRFFPVPYATLSLETEFTQGNPDSDESEEQRYRHMELTGTAGVRFELLPQLDLKIGGGYQDEMDRPDDDPHVVFEFGYELRKIQLSKINLFPVFLESRLDYLKRAESGNASQKVLWQNRLLVSLNKYLAFYFGYNLFQYYSEDPGVWARSEEVLLGLGISFATKHQSS